MARRTWTVVTMALGLAHCGFLGDAGNAPDVPVADGGDTDTDSDVDRDVSLDIGEICDADELARSLEQASAGDTVIAGACTIVGTFTVPVGVTLSGTVGATILQTPGDAFRPVLTLRTRAGYSTRVTDLTIESSSNWGIVAVGGGGIVEATRVTVRATRGVAIGVEQIGSLKLTTVELEGPFAEGGTIRAEEALPESTATHGLVVVRGGTAELEGVFAMGFAGYGVVLVGTTTVWTGGGASNNLGTGLAVSGGDTTLDGVDLSKSHWLGGPRIGPPIGGPDSVPPAFGGVFVDGAVVRSTNLVISGGEAFGLVHDGGMARHEGLVAHGNGDAAVWAQGMQSFEVTGTGTTLGRNRYAGIVVLDPVALTIRDAVVEDTRWGCHDCGTVGVRDAADGIQIIRPRGGAALANLVLRNNERVGLLLDMGGGTMDGMTLSGIEVYGTGEQFGAVAQNGDVSAAWDTEIARSGETGITDYGTREILTIAGHISVRSFVSVGRLGRTGLRGLIDPDPPH